jgi:hexosaminidase
VRRFLRGHPRAAFGFVVAVMGDFTILATTFRSRPGVNGSNETRGAPPRVIPAPVSLETVPDQSFSIGPDTHIAVDRGANEAVPVAEYLAFLLRRSTGYTIPVVGRDRETEHSPSSQKRTDIGPGNIVLKVFAPIERGREGYQLDVGENGVQLQAPMPEGLFRGVQTLRQLLPAKVESDVVQRGPWTVPGVHITDYPRFAWRGAMLDVARHFMSVDDVKRYIDLIAMYKANVLHLHLSDDQGWRIYIDRWPRLAEYGGTLEVGGTPGGYYTKADYSEIARWAAARFITIVPEIDGPGHAGAALASYAELNCNGQAPRLYTGTRGGFNSLCASKELTYQFLGDVIAEIAELTTGPYFHIGGDEAGRTPLSDYIMFIDRVEKIVLAHGKKMVGWHEIARANVSRDSVAEYWSNASGSDPGADLARRAVEKGMKLVMAPADRAYLDMKYDSSTALGLHWSGFVDVQRSYEWDPATHITGVTEADVLGVEAPLWTETIPDIRDVEFMAFPRLPGLAEIGWSSRERSWDEYRVRLAAQAPRWTALGMNFYRSPQVVWDEAS